MFANYLLQALVLVLIFFLAYGKWKLSYWKRRNIFCEKVSFFFGSMENPFGKKRETMGVQIRYMYENARRMNLRHMGYYIMWLPAYIPLDPQMVKNILTKDFDYFPERMDYRNDKVDPLGANLTTLGHKKWRPLRAKLTPTFTSGKMKMMFPIIVACSDQLKIATEDLIKIEDPVDVLDVMGRYTMNVIGSCAFGIDCNTFENVDSDFIKYVKRVVQLTKWDELRNVFAFSAPGLSKLLKIPMIAPEVSEFFLGMLREAVKKRKTNAVVRNDFLHLLICLKNETVVEDGITKQGIITMEEMSAQTFIFFLAGFDTSSKTMTFCLLELALNPEIQQKARQEIDRVLDNHDGKLSYEALQEMKYLQQVIDETLRKYPPVPILQRNCVADYKISDSNDYITKGTAVVIPILGLHYDPEYFPDPEKFDPERFSDANKHKIVPFTYLPFGDGPRNCIGFRFGLMQVKVGLVTLLKNFAFSLNQKTQLPIRMNPRTFFLSVLGNVWLDVQKRE